MIWFTLCDFQWQNCVVATFFWDPYHVVLFSIFFEQECFKKGKSVWRKKQGICLGFPTFDLSQCQQQNKNPQHLDIMSFWVVCARNSRTERTHTHSLSYTLHIFTPYICWIPLMKHECWDRVVASLKPAKGQIVDVQEWSRTLVTCFFRQNHVSLYCVVVLNSKDDLLAIAWPPGHASQIFMRPQTAWRQKHMTYSHNLSYICMIVVLVHRYFLSRFWWSHEVTTRSGCSFRTQQVDSSDQLL